MEEQLRVEHLHVSYHHTPVLRDVSLTLAPGEILGVVGQSGCGKSTLLRAMIGLLGQGGKVTGGEIWVQGQGVTRLSLRELEQLRGDRLGMIFQDAAGSLCPVRTVGSQVYESMAAHSRLTRAQARAQALDLFDKLDIPQGERVWKAYPFQLSGGMIQRVCIALAMLLRPGVLLADEPTSALDVVAQRRVLEELLRLRALFGTAMVVVSHDFGVVSAVADRIMVLHQGCVVECGPAAQVLEQPQNSHTRQLLAAAPRLRRER